MRNRVFALVVAATVAAGMACARADVSLTQTPEMILPTKVDTATAVPPSITPSPTVVPTITTTPTPATPQVPASATPPPTPTQSSAGNPETVVYEAQAGDNLRAVAIRFGVLPQDIQPAEGNLPAESDLIDPGTLLLIPRRLGPTGPDDLLMPDSEFVYSPHAAEFDPVSFMAGSDGFLADYTEYVGNRWRSGAEVIAIAARDNSVSPRLLMAMLEYKAGWVTDPSRPTGDDFRYPLGYQDPNSNGLYRQLTWLANEMGKGYYSWRMGALTDLVFPDGSIVRIAPELNAASVAVQTFMARDLGGRAWADSVSPQGFIATYRDLFGDPWQYMHPLFEPGVRQPTMILPFMPGRVWAFTGGPHGAWEREAAWAALDFAPPSIASGCIPSEEWVVAAAPGLVLRSGGGVVVLDLDGDGREHTGWVLIYLHVSNQGSVQAGDFVEQGDLIGHPSCEGGLATGTHVHLVRKYNGEWILADGSLPFEMSGWVARAGAVPYQGALVNGDQEVLACTCSSAETLISR